MILFMGPTFSLHLLGCQWRHRALSLVTVCYMLWSILTAVFFSFRHCWLAFRFNHPVSRHCYSLVPLSLCTSMCVFLHSRSFFLNITFVNCFVENETLFLTGTFKISTVVGNAQLRLEVFLQIWAKWRPIFPSLQGLQVHPLKTTKIGRGRNMVLH